MLIAQSTILVMPNVRRWGVVVLVFLGMVSFGVAVEPAVTYEISLKDASAHYADITMTYSSPGTSNIQMPVWNATYMVRDFSQHIVHMQAATRDAQTTPVALDKTTWRIDPGADARAVIHYRIYLADPGPFGAEVSSDHAFFNFAQLLPYVAGHEHEKEAVAVKFIDVPTDWKLATALASDGFTVHASSYDELVDSPTELGRFEAQNFDEGGKHYHVIVHGRKDDYDIARMAQDCQKIVRAETAFMQEAPFTDYTFIYHVGANGGGGMEHKYSTAIGLQPLKSEQAWRGFDGVTAHEFFHLWNVKRIRPQALEPVDYTQEQYTRDLWFSEGFTSTVGEYALLHAGLETPAAFEKHLGETVQAFRERPAHLWQSPEESSLETWYDKYPFYGGPERSVSYYTSGELIGYTIDLLMRDKTDNKKGLRDAFLWMNAAYPHQDKFFPESSGELGAFEAVSGADFKNFFADNIARASDLPLEQALTTAGLLLKQAKVTVGDSGFTLTRGTPVVSGIHGEKAKAAGLREGDEIVALNGEAAGRGLQRRLSNTAPGTQLNLQVRRAGAEIPLKVPVGSRETEQWQVSEMPNATPGQIARRKAWMYSFWEAEQ